jgi:tight adherence protein B
MVLIQQLAALLRGGRSTSKLWEELWTVHGGEGRAGGGGPGRQSGGGPGHPAVTPPSARLSPASLDVLAAARAASALGASTADAIRGSLDHAFARQPNTSTARPSPAERRIWDELAACLDVAETSGCPLADILTRFCAQLEAGDDADAARQTALAGPKATVRLLSWLPVLGLGLGMVLGVDPLGILLGNAVGVAALVAGVVLTVAGRVWSSRLVSSAAGGP